MSKGVFISLEGIDGVGKTTLLSNLAELLEKDGHSVLKTKEPGDVINGEVVGSDLGKGLRELLWFKPSTNAMAPGVADLLLLADHVQVTELVIKPALKEGKIVLCDRYADSQFAYSGQKTTPDWANKLFRERFDLKPDITVLVLCNPEVAWNRSKGRSGDEGKRQEGKAWKGPEAAAKIQTAYLQQLGGLPRTIEVDVTTMNIEEATQAVYNAVKAKLHGKKE